MAATTNSNIPAAAGHDAPLDGAFVRCASESITRCLRAAGAALGEFESIGKLLPGKMLRTRLAGRLQDAMGTNAVGLTDLCAAVELVHTASLCHDDVIDNALVRRARPALQHAAGSAGSVLIGDLVLCQAMILVHHAAAGRHMLEFLARMQEVVAAEAAQEVIHRGRTLDEQTCLRIARQKTGPLFAFAARICGDDDDDALSGALTEAGYRVGTAYQLADDLIDVLGDEQAAGKTLGTDAARGKFTLPQLPENGIAVTREHIGRLCQSAVGALTAWPAAREGVSKFILEDMQPVLHGIDLNLEMQGTS